LAKKGLKIKKSTDLGVDVIQPRPLPDFRDSCLPPTKNTQRISYNSPVASVRCWKLLGRVFRLPRCYSSISSWK